MDNPAFDAVGQQRHELSHRAVRRDQNLRNAFRRRPAGFAVAGDPFAFIERRWVKTGATRQTGSRVSVFGSEPVYGAPYILMSYMEN